MRPLDSYRLGNETFPPLNPSKAMPASTTPPAQTPMQEPEMPTQSQEVPEVPSTPSAPKKSDKLIGVGKALGQSVTDNLRFGSQVVEKMKPEGGPIKTGIKTALSALNPLGRFVGWPLEKPKLETPEAVKPVFDKADEMLKPSNPEQEKYKRGTELATLLTPLLGASIARAPGAARRLEELSLRLTSTEKRELGARLEGVTDFLVKNGITGNPTQRLEKAQNVYEKSEERLQKFLGEEVADVKSPREVFAMHLESVKHRLMANQRDITGIENQMDEAITSFLKNYQDSPMIRVADFNEWKRTVMKDAFNKAGLKVRDDVEFAIGDAANEMLRDSLRGRTIDGMSFEDFNREYSRIVEARKLLYKAENRDQLEMIGKVMSTMLFGGLGSGIAGTAGFAAGGFPLAAITGPVGGTAGVALGNKLSPILAGTAMRSNVGQIYESLAPLEPMARKALALLLLAPGSLAGNDEEASAPASEVTPTEDTKATPPAGLPPLDSYKQ